MALEISEFNGVAAVGGQSVPLVDGAPLEVHTSNGAKTMGATSAVIRIKGTGTITWANGKAETFEGIEFRRVRANQTFTVS